MTESARMRWCSLLDGAWSEGASPPAKCACVRVCVRAAKGRGFRSGGEGVWWRVAVVPAKQLQLGSSLPTLQDVRLDKILRLRPVLHGLPQLLARHLTLERPRHALDPC